jgi:hypothetical protein
MFSAINSRLLRLRSVKVRITWFVLVGCVHCLNRASTQTTPARLATLSRLRIFSILNCALPFEE